jgi:hypothetical protein
MVIKAALIAAGVVMVLAIVARLAWPRIRTAWKKLVDRRVP